MVPMSLISNLPTIKFGFLHLSGKFSVEKYRLRPYFKHTYTYSGPQRYDFDEQHQTWFYHRDNHRLQDVLNTELSAALGYDIDLLEGFEPEEQ